jgi:acyl carrier protein
VPIGRPIDNVHVYVLDDAGQPVPIGVPGMLFVGGAGVARGYLGNPGRTAERFLPDPADPRGSLLYRTGDIVCWNGDGTLEFRGRTDDQVKIRGFRVEPGEVTHVLRGLEGVADAVVLPRRDANGDAYLAAFVVSSGGVPDDRPARCARLSARLAHLLPSYLVPRAWALLDTLPLNGNGKLDRAALPEPAVLTAAPSAVAGITGPADSLTRTLRLLWAAELDVEPDRIGTHISFFDLGGHSITAMRLLNRVREALGMEYPVLEFFQRPTITAMASHVRPANGGNHRGDHPARLRGSL